MHSIWVSYMVSPAKTLLAFYLPYVQMGYDFPSVPGMSSKRAASVLWREVDKIVRRAERAHFKRCYQYDTQGRSHSEGRHEDRVLAFYELARAFWHKSPGWVVVTYQRAFSEIEAVLQCRRIGIGLEDNGHILNFRTKFIKYFVLYFKVKRSAFKGDYESYYHHENSRYPCDKHLTEYNLYVIQIEDCIRRCPTASVYGFGDEKELERRALDYQRIDI